MRARLGVAHHIAPSKSRKADGSQTNASRRVGSSPRKRGMYHSTLTHPMSRATVRGRAAGQGDEESPARRGTDAGTVGREGQRVPRVRQLRRAGQAPADRRHVRPSVQGDGPLPSRRARPSPQEIGRRGNGKDPIRSTEHLVRRHRAILRQPKKWPPSYRALPLQGRITRKAVMLTPRVDPFVSPFFVEHLIV